MEKKTTQAKKKPKGSQGRSFMIGDRQFVLVDSAGRIRIPKNDLPENFLRHGYHFYVQNGRLHICLDEKLNENVDCIRLQIPQRIRKAHDIKENTIFECERSTEFDGFILTRIEGTDLIGG